MRFKKGQSHAQELQVQYGAATGPWNSKETASEFYARLIQTGASDQTRSPNDLQETDASRLSDSNDAEQNGDHQTSMHGGMLAKDDSNAHHGIGYKLLRMAGWKGQGGLGADEQGISEPLEAWKQGGRQGIGAHHSQRVQEAETAAIPDKKDPAASVTLSEAVLASQAKQQQHQNRFDSTKARLAKQGRAPKREWQTVAVEEPLDKKVKRWRQVLQAEADEKISKAIDREIFRAFNSDFEYDTNPLKRRHNLTVSNPLL